MGFWSDLVGQEDAVETLLHASSAAGRDSLAHAWLITGPPGSGRFNLALKFAAVLVTHDTTDTALTHTHLQIIRDSHPDVTVVRTEANDLTVAQAREAVAAAYYAPAASAYRVIVIEDADRMNPQAANALLKALEEPPETTVWILSAPSEADLLPTIRSRTRLLRLVTPSIDAVAALLNSRDGVALELAKTVAGLAQGHIGMARRLATDTDAFQRRTESILAPLAARSLADMMAASAKLFALAVADSEALIGEQLTSETAALRRSLGIEPDAKVPREHSRQFRELEENGKRRMRRAKIDGVDRILLDLLTLCRDALAVQLDAGVELINAPHRKEIMEFVDRVGRQRVLEFAAGLEEARARLGRNVTPQAALEAALLGLITGAGR